MARGVSSGSWAMLPVSMIYTDGADENVSLAYRGETVIPAMSKQDALELIALVMTMYEIDHAKGDFE